MIPKQSREQLINHQVDRIIDDAREKICAQLDSLGIKNGLSDQEIVDIVRTRHGDNYADDFYTYALENWQADGEL